jgi:multiple sugar transport system substrate-binding protein
MRAMKKLLCGTSGLALLAFLAFAACSDDNPAPKDGGSGGSSGSGGGGSGGGGSGGGGSGGTGGRDAAVDASASDGGAADARDGGATDGADAATSAVELKVSWWGSPDRDMRTQKVIDLFMAKNPTIKVTTEHYANTQGMGIVGTDYWPTLNDHATKKTLPDIMQHDYAYIEEWTQRDLVLPLDALIADKTINLADVPAGVIDGCKVNGKVMAISLGTNTQSIVLDTNAFADAGVALPKDDWTWADFERIALEIKQKRGIWGFGTGLHGYTPGWKAVTLSTNKWVFSDDGKSLGYTDDQPWIDHWKMILRLQTAGAIPHRWEEPMTSNIEAVPLAVGKAAMEFAHSNQLVALWTAAGTARTLKAVPVPKVVGGKSPVYLKPSQYFAVTKDSKHPKEAAMLIDFFTNDVDANIVLGGERGVPVSTKVLAALKPKLSKLAAESFDLIERAAAYATKLPPNDPPAWTPILTQIFGPKVIEPIMYEVWTPEVAVAVFRTEASAVLAGSPVPDSGAPTLPSRDAGPDSSTD